MQIKFLGRIISHLFFHILREFRYHLYQCNGEIDFWMSERELMYLVIVSGMPGLHMITLNWLVSRLDQYSRKCCVPEWKYYAMWVSDAQDFWALMNISFSSDLLNFVTGCMFHKLYQSLPSFVTCTWCVLLQRGWWHQWCGCDGWCKSGWGDPENIGLHRICGDTNTVL
jgi:hypothetical protein